jgi:hypothetical protein
MQMDHNDGGRCQAAATRSTTMPTADGGVAWTAQMVKRRRTGAGSGAASRGIGLASTRDRMRLSEMFERKEWQWQRRT